MSRSSELRIRLSACPGFVGCDPGKVVIEPAYVTEAVRWLKRRYIVNENLELSQDTGLVIEIQERTRNSCKSGGARRNVSFVKPVQYELAF